MSTIRLHQSSATLESTIAVTICTSLSHVIVAHPDWKHWTSHSTSLQQLFSSRFSRSSSCGPPSILPTNYSKRNHASRERFGLSSVLILRENLALTHSRRLRVVCKKSGSEQRQNTVSSMIPNTILDRTSAQTFSL